MDLTEKTLESTTIFEGKIMTILYDQAQLPNGKVAAREVCLHPGGVGVLPLDKDGTVSLVRQYRYPLHELLLEIPAGKLDYKGEDPLSAAIRELREETGAVADRMTYMGEFFSSPAILDERIHMYLAEGLTFGDTDFDEDEFIETVRIPLGELVDMIMDGKIIDGKTQAAVMRAARAIEKRN